MAQLPGRREPRSPESRCSQDPAGCGCERGADNKAQRGCSRDRRSDCKQICIALVVTKDGIPLGCETFAGNRLDVTTVEEIVETMEDRYGRADRIWAMDRGMISQENLAFLREGGRRYIVGTPKGMLRKFERDLLSKDWESIHEGLEVKRKVVDVVLPTRDGTEIRRRCVTRPDDHQAIPLQRLGLNLPRPLPVTDKKPTEM